MIWIGPTVSDKVALVVGAFLSTLLFGYLFRWTATARAVRPMLERRTPPSSIEFSLIKHVPKTVRISVPVVIELINGVMSNPAMLGGCHSLPRSLSSYQVLPQFGVWSSHLKWSVTTCCNGNSATPPTMRASSLQPHPWCPS